MTLGIGFLILPSYTKQVGLVPAIIIIVLGAFINYKTYQFIFEAAYYTKIFNYFDLVENLLGKYTRYVFNLTYFLDMMSTVICYAIMTWRILVYLLNNLGYIPSNWILVPADITLDIKQPDQIFWRRIYFVVLFLVTIPMFLKKSLNSFQFISMIYLGVMIILVIIIYLSLYPYYNKFQ
jgi:amino acid permease